jgi:hypothetical protein
MAARRDRLRADGAPFLIGCGEEQQSHRTHTLRYSRDFLTKDLTEDIEAAIRA